MAVQFEVPGHLKKFAGAFSLLCSRENPVTAFGDFLDYTIACVSRDGDQELADRLKSSYGKDYPHFNEALHAYIFAIHDNMDDRGWADPLGDLYMSIASKYQSKSMGQFFTPESICQLMTDLTLSAEDAYERTTACDPAVGSGRTLLSVLARFPHLKLYGADLDRTCAKMSVVNLAFHGGRGEISCMDSISLKWFFGYRINPHYLPMPAPPMAPMVVPIGDFTQSVFHPVEQVEPREVSRPSFVQVEQPSHSKSMPKMGNQLTLF